MTTLQKFLAEISFIQIKEIKRHSKGLLLALENSNRKEMLDYVILSHEEIDKTSPIELYERISHEYNYTKPPLNSRS